MARCVFVQTALGLVVLAIAVAFGLRGDGRLWRGGAAIAAAADMAGKAKKRAGAGAPNSSTWSSSKVAIASVCTSMSSASAVVYS